jgi:TolB protein
MAAALAAGGAAVIGVTSAAAETVTAPNAQVAFTRLTGTPDDQNYEVWTMDRAGGNQKRLTWNEVADHDPQWSPDGERIVWVRYDAPRNTGPAELWTMNADGSQKKRLTSPAMVGNPTWSPDGSQIAFEQSNRIWVMDADGTDMHAISPEGVFDIDPDWSPDGEWIAFSSSGARTFDLHVMRPDGSDRRLLVATNGTNDYDASWSNDGRRIAYSANKTNGSGWFVGVMRADGRGHHIAVDTYSLDPTWASTGNDLAFHGCSNIDGRVECGLHTSSFRGDDLEPLGYRGVPDIQPDYRR